MTASRRRSGRRDGRAARRRDPGVTSDGGRPSGEGAPPGRAPPERRFTETEVRDILRRATDLETTPALPGPGSGLSLSEIERAAEEAGIDRSAVRGAALATLPSTERSLGARLVGGSARHRHTLRLPGRIPEGDGRGSLERALERVFERELVAVEAGEALILQEDHTQGSTRIELREAGGGVELVVDVDRRGWLALLALGAAAVVAVVASLVGSGAVALFGPFATVLGAGALTVGLTRAGWKPAAARIRRRVERAAAEVAGRLEPDRGT